MTKFKVICKTCGNSFTVFYFFNRDSLLAKKKKILESGLSCSKCEKIYRNNAKIEKINFLKKEIIIRHDYSI